MKKKVLEYLEFNVVDHCNMRCKGCALFATIAPENYINLSQHKLDMDRLAELFRNIKLIRLIGGEPLLNPNINKVIEITREAFPNSEIRILTNGILLEALDDDFWTCLKNQNVKIDITLYPPYYDKETIYKNISKVKNIPIKINKKYHFKLFIRKDGKGDKEKTFSKCSFKVSTFLRNGHISACHMPSMSYILNQHFKTNLSDKGTMDIHDNIVSADDILDFLQKPLDVCRYCISDPEKFNWESGTLELNEWSI